MGLHKNTRRELKGEKKIGDIYISAAENIDPPYVDDVPEICFDDPFFDLDFNTGTDGEAQ